MVEIFSIKYKTTEHYAVVQEKLALIFMGCRTKVNVSVCEGFVRFKTRSGITEKDRHDLESLIRSLIEIFGKE